jgi:hypothetical protein
MPSASRCLICDASVPQLPAICSTACVAAALQEVQQNVQRSRRLPRSSAAADARYSLASRNGQLMAAVLGHRGDERTVAAG